MKAAVVRAFGEPLDIEERPDPHRDSAPLQILPPSSRPRITSMRWPQPLHQSRQLPHER